MSVSSSVIYSSLLTHHLSLIMIGSLRGKLIYKKPDNVIQLGVPPVRVDIVTSLTGIPWESALEQRVQGRYGDVQVHYIGREQFILNKRSMGRKKDLADIEALGEK